MTMKKVLLLLAGVGLVASMYAGLPVALTVTKTTKICTPDGVVTAADEPWTSTWIPCSYEKAANSTHGMTSKWQIAYNDVYLWVLAQQDGNTEIDTLYSEDPWQRDCFEVFVGMDTTDFIYTGVYKEGDFQFRMGRACDFPHGYNDTMNAATGKFATATHPFTDAGTVAQRCDNFTIGQVENGTSFIQEWQLPWNGMAAAMKDSGTFLGDYIKFEIQAADNTTHSAGGRTQQNFWRNNSDVEYNNTRTFSLIYLNGKVDTALAHVNVPKTQISDISVTVLPNSIQLSRSAKATLYNIQGQIIKSVNGSSISTTGLAAGVYFVNANNKSMRVIIK
jgi:hypothetical protein